MVLVMFLANTNAYDKNYEYLGGEGRAGLCDDEKHIFRVIKEATEKNFNLN